MLELETKASGAFSIALRNAVGETTYETSKQGNIICNNFFVAADSLYAFLAVGTGNTTPTVADTTLANQVGSRLTSGGGGWTVESKTVTAGLMTIVTKYVYTFALGQFTANLSELGLFAQSTGANALTRALIKDSNGDPTVIPVTANDQLVVTYYLTYTQAVSQTPYVVSMMINGVATDVTVSAFFVNPARWGFYNPMRILDYNLAVAVGSTSTINTDTGSCSGTAFYVSAASNAGVTIPLAGSSDANGRILRKTINFGLTVANTTFDEIYLLTAASTSLTNAVIALRLDTPITKGDTETVDIEIHHILKAA